MMNREYGRMRKHIDLIIGKTINGIVSRVNKFSPRSQIILSFSDGTHYELYCHNGLIEGSKTINHGPIAEIPDESENLIQRQ